ncbi:MFS general substrate transporter [Lindgomyces ingoldianus]|uniref:MFS general substrate transporter n=1 Tax=Lindgomyces ingoldianus TaxID=673940 RepID=A0ACB6QVW8_9PLEO|nr:MFS general substrate transporter [Lindgomyces ingoldianus]KAF2470723.1 MFS general substrate transporter [Lindgomyces ingoldianus]
MSRSERSNSDTSDPGAAQFLHGLSPQQLHHLQYSVPSKDAPERFSQFLEEPRRPPVPKRFTFDVLDLAARQKATRSVTRSTTPTTEILLKEVDRVRKVDWRFHITLACICMLNLVAAWDATSLSIILPTIASALHGSAVQSFWLSISFLVAATALQPLYASCAGIFGRKAMLITALTFFTIGTFIAAVTGNFTGLLLGRSLQGIGAGGFYVMTDLILADLIYAEDRKRWSAFIGATWVVGIVTGPVIGSALAERGQWRWIFWINLPFCGFAFIVLPAFAQLKLAEGDILRGLRKVDWLGIVLFSGSLISVLLGLTWGGIQHPWSNFRTTLPIQVGLVGFVVFLLWSRFSPFTPILNLDSFMDSTSLATYFGATMQGTIAFTALYFLPLYFEVAKPDLSLVETGISLFPWTFALCTIATVTAVAVSNTTWWRPAIWLGWSFVIIGTALTTLFKRGSATPLWVCIAMLLGVGLGILYPSLRAALQAAARSGSMTSAVTNYGFFQTLGQTLGVAIGSAVFQNQLHEQLLENKMLERLAIVYAKDSIALIQTIRAMPGGEGTLKTDLADAYVDSMRTIWIIMAALAGTALVVSFFTKAVFVTQESAAEQNEMKTFDEER